LIELVYRSPRISLPEIGFVCVDGHELYFTSRCRECNPREHLPYFLKCEAVRSKATLSYRH
jgi:hypothetical protein